MCNHLQYIATSYETADFIDTANGSEVERKVIKRESIFGKFQCTEQKSSNYLEQSTESVQRLAGSLVIQVKCAVLHSQAKLTHVSTFTL